MQLHPTILSQITAGLYATEFHRCARQYAGARPTRGLSEYDHFLALCFAQLTYRESLRDIVLCLKSRQSQLYHAGFRGHLSRTNLAYANNHRDWRLFRSVAEVLMRRAAKLYAGSTAVAEFPGRVFALDASMISLSLNLFPWGYYARSRQAALKLHLLLSLQGNLPAWAAITEAHLPEMKMLDQIPIQAGAFYVMDRGYLDFVRLGRLHEGGAHFVVRSKHHVAFEVHGSRRLPAEDGFRSDEIVRLRSHKSRKRYPHLLRLVRVIDVENGGELALLSNELNLPAVVMAELYRRRWQVELFFKWMKQHLRVRGFYGRSPNAVRCQVWSAICAHLLVAIAKKRTGLSESLNQILQVVSVGVFEQVPIGQLVAQTGGLSGSENAETGFQNMLSLNY